ncbi:MAG: UPF0262 family protein [Rhodospirillales bacterium]|nr:MAG: UPF0262 family protein [Rhodospirillales bacterium]
MPDDARADRILDIALDEGSMPPRSPEAEHDRRVAIFDLIEDNSFALAGERGPYRLRLTIMDSRLVFDVRADDDRKLRDIVLSLTPLRKVVKDYFMICESYYDAIKKLSPSQIEALDMGRRGLHNEGSEVLRERLAGKIEVDFDTARRLFTLVCALLAKG